MSIPELLNDTLKSLELFFPETSIICGLLLALVAGILPLRESSRRSILKIVGMGSLLVSLSLGIQDILIEGGPEPYTMFAGMLQSDGFTTFLKCLLDLGGLFTLFMSSKQSVEKRYAEYLALLLAAVMGAHLFVMSANLVMVFLSMEIISISSYLLAGYSFDKAGAEGSMKYFLFGTVSSALMLYGLTFLYGITGTLEFLSPEFQQGFEGQNGLLFYFASLLGLAGFLFKISAFPMHPWAPDVYEAAPLPVVAFFSVVPKIAGLGILTRFVWAIGSYGETAFDWQILLAIIAILTLFIGNLSALRQRNPKRMMAYSSIAHSGFLLIGIVMFVPQGISMLMFYAAVYLLMNFLVFSCLQYYEEQGIRTMEDFSGVGPVSIWPMMCLVTGLIALTGLPPTAGFTAKLLMFSGLWESYTGTGKSWLLVLQIVGLLNTVIALFYYLRIPYYAFLRTGTVQLSNKLTATNFFWGILVLLILFLFFQPQLLMGLINKSNFVLYERT